MKAVVQRVSSSKVSVDGREVSKIGRGMNVLLGVMNGDTKESADVLADKIASLRFFEDGEGKMNLSIQDIKGEALVVSQFTLCASLKKGRRPSFDPAAAPELAQQLYEHFVSRLSGFGINVKTGEFAAHMIVDIVNDGPVTFVMDSKEFI
jgi:D-aminoacyl-tRNA deacylase